MLLILAPYLHGLRLSFSTGRDYLAMASHFTELQESSDFFWQSEYIDTIILNKPPNNERNQ